MGCDIHLKLEYRRKEVRKVTIRPEMVDENGKKHEEISYTLGTDWTDCRIFEWETEWGGPRCYGMFAILGNNSRNRWGLKPIEQRGFPKDATNATKQLYAYYIVVKSEEEADKLNKEEGYQNYYYIPMDRAKEYVDKGLSEWVHIGEKKSNISSPDYHSANWCTTEEMEEAINTIYTKSGTDEAIEYDESYQEWMALLGAMKGYETGGFFECRAVFWFDN